MNCTKFSLTSALAALSLALIAHSGPVLANDSTATLGAGGIVLLKSAEIAILSEKLALSADRITVDYEMQNLSKDPVETLVAFPLPRLSGPALVNIDVETDKDRPDNFVNFTVSVDGKPVQTEREIKAFAIEDGGRDVTAELTKAGIILPPVARDFYQKLESLPATTKAALISKKLLIEDRFEDGASYTPLWETQITYSWRQRFEPGAIVKIHHHYNPVAGRSFFGEFSFGEETKEWCLNGESERSARALLAKQPEPKNSATYLERRQVDYILSTGANWAGPIRSFELTIETKSPEWMIAHCIEGLAKISPTTYRVTKTGFTPTRELSILFLGPIEKS